MLFGPTGSNLVVLGGSSESRRGGTPSAGKSGDSQGDSDTVCAQARFTGGDVGAIADVGATAADVADANNTHRIHYSITINFKEGTIRNNYYMNVTGGCAFTDSSGVSTFHVRKYCGTALIPITVSPTPAFRGSARHSSSWASQWLRIATFKDGGVENT